MEIAYKICPVCGQHPICLPHEVCSVCYHKIKNTSGLDEVLKEKERCTNDGIELHHYQIDDWHEIEINGLGATQVIGEYILDDIEDDEDHHWHKRRIRFMQDMVRELDMGYFAPTTRQQIDEFAQDSVDFWDGKFSKDVAREKVRSMSYLLQKRIEDIGKWEPKDFLLWMMQTEDLFDWMWYQWFECIYDCIPDKCNDELWIKMFHKHFHNEIKAWVNKKS